MAGLDPGPIAVVSVAVFFLVWYYARLSQIGVVYGSLATAIVVLLSLEIGATLLLFGAQVISEYERRGHGEPRPLRTG